MSTWLLPRSDLTPEQLRGVQLPWDEHKLILGLPGSGKTQVLIHRADYLRERLKTQLGKFRVFIFTNVLRDYIRSGLELLNLPLDSVCTFDHFCVEFYQRHISRNPPWKSEERTYDFLKIREAVLACLSSRADLSLSLDFALVDEGQDLTPESFTILKYLARHVTVFADHLQQIYEKGSDEGTILYQLGITRQHLTLLGAYRNSPDVAQLAAYFIPDEERRRQYLSQIRAGQVERERPLLFIPKTMDEEMDRLAEITRQRQFKNQRIGIIVPMRKQVYGLADGLAERGVAVEKAISGPYKTRVGGTTNVRFDNMTPKIVSYHSAKGLTFDCVLLPRLTEGSFQRFDLQIRQRLLFVGIARAMCWVYLSTVEGNESRECLLLKKAAENNHLIIQNSSSPSSFKPSGKEGKEEEEYSAL